MPTFLALLGMFISVLLIGIILLQRGRGGGLVGALSGLGGQSAFGTKAGDTFTRITIALAAVWVLLAGIHGQVLRARTEKFKNDATEISSTSKDQDSGSKKSEDGKSESGLGSLSEPKDEGTKKDDASKSTTKKSDESTKELTPDDEKKSEAAPKSKETPKKELDDSADSKSDDKGSKSEGQDGEKK